MAVSFTERSFCEAMRFLYNRTNYETFTSLPYSQLEWNLKRLSAFLEFLGHPDRKMKIIHVAGTKGKGSVCFLLEKILRDSGLKTGLFTSPHLHSILERFMINGIPCSKKAFAEIIQKLQKQWNIFQNEYQNSEKANQSNRAQKAEKDKEPKEPEDFDNSDTTELTFFEWSVLIAFELFAQAGVDIAIMEVGLGGRFDATNICLPEVTVITEISYDHLEQLGDTLQKIALEKAGIIKEKCPLVSGVRGALFLEQNPEQKEHFITEKDIEAIEQAICSEAKNKKAPLIAVKTIPSFVESLPLVIYGAHQKWNLAVVTAVLDVLKQHGVLKQHAIDISEENIQKSLADFQLPARVEIVSQSPFIVIDGAHNRASCAALTQAMNEILQKNPLLVPGKKTLLFGISRGKDIPGMLAELVKYFDEIIITSSDSTRAMPAIELYEKVLHYATAFQRSESIIFRLCDNVPTFLNEYYFMNWGKNNLLCTCGSFYLAEEVSSCWSKILRGKS